MQSDETLNEYDARLSQMYTAGQINADDFFSNCEHESTKLYLSKDNPRAQSGHGSDIYRWRNVRWMILEPIHFDGSFIDIGCANGHLISTFDSWMRNSDVNIEFYGLEISPALCNLAKKLYPKLSEHIYCGNAINWNPPFQYDYVYTMIYPDLPSELRKKMLQHLYENVLKKNGRLILGPFDKKSPYEDEIENNGFHISGYIEKTIPPKNSEVKRVVWIEKMSYADIA